MKSDPLYPLGRFSEEDIDRMKPPMKVGILATITPQGLPHLTLISTLMASSPEQVVWGKFMEGMSKENILLNPKAGFMIMTLDKVMWRGKADFNHLSHEGPDFDAYNYSSLFRYNAYFGVNTVYYMDLQAQTGPRPLPMNRVIFAAVKTMLARTFSGKGPSTKVMNAWTRAFFDKLDNLKFLGYIGEDGYPVIIPVIQAQSLDSAHLAFSFGAFGDELVKIPAGKQVAVFSMALTMEDVLVRGIYQGRRRLAGISCGVVQIDWVYNAMPPTPMQIYPPVELQPVRNFNS
jgi:hypothetical protein